MSGSVQESGGADLVETMQRSEWLSLLKNILQF